MAKLLPTDKFLVQRGEAKLVAFASDLELYQESTIGDAIDGIDLKLDAEIAARKVGDQQLDSRIDSLASRIRIGVDGLFPSRWEHRYEFDLQLTPNYNFLTEYTNCVNSGSDEDDCYLTHIRDFYTTYANLTQTGATAGKFTGEFKNAADTTSSNLRTLVIDDRYVTNGEVLDWDSVKEGDFLTITPINAFTNDLDNFGLYQVKKNLVNYFIQNGDISSKINEQNCFQLEYLGGNDNLDIRQTFSYDIRVMNDIATNLADDFVKKSGDTMSGDLRIENTAGLYTKLVDSGEDVDLVINRDGVRKMMVGSDETVQDQKNTYIQAAADSVSNPLDLVHKQYVDDVVVIAGQELNDLSDQVDILNNRIEAVGKILEQYELVCVSGDGCDGLSEPDYSNCAEPKMSNGDLRFQFVGDDTNASVQGLQANQTILFSKKDKDNRDVVLTGFGIDDTIEFFAETGKASNVIYKATAIEQNSDYYKVTAQYQYGAKSNEAQNGETYRLKFYKKFEGISASEAASLFVNKTGDDMTGPLTFSKSGSSTEEIITISDTNSSTVKIKNGNGIEISSLDQDVSVSVGTLNINNNKTTKLLDDGLRTDATITPSLKFRVGSDLSTLTVTSTNINAENHPILNVSILDNNETCAANVKYVNDKISEGLTAGAGITSSYSDGVRTFGLDTSYFNIHNLSDLRDTTPTDGDTLVYNGTTGKWEFTSGSQVNKGKSLVSDSEESAEIGGLWTDGKNYFIKTS